MFVTLNKIAKSLYKRSEDDLSPVIPENHTGFVPSELDSFILALNRLFSKVDDGIQSKRRFIADAAHEMRTPLTALSLQAESLEKEELSPGARLKVQRLKDGISRERQLMTSLLTLAREQNRTDLMMETIDIFDLYTRLIDEQEVLADRKGIDLGVEGNVQFKMVSDRMRLMRIMSNLLSNAIKYTPDGGRIDLMAHKFDDGRIQLIVQDNGPGIPEDHLKHILEPFYRVCGDRSEIQGTGLGLAIVKASCDSINARLEFANCSPHGLVATVTLMPEAQPHPGDKSNRLLS
nr:HAMP domain-containing sensor histidine kinase [Anaerobiospirillum sp. NML02-A-032]